MKTTLALVTLGVLLIIADDLAGRLIDYCAKRKRDKDMRKYAMTAFKAVNRNWWEA